MDLPDELQLRIMEELQSDTVIVFIMSDKGRYLSLLGGSNRRFYSDGSKLIGKSYPEVLCEEKASYFQSLIDRVIQTGEVLEVEYNLSLSDFMNTISGGPESIQRFHVTILPFRLKKDDPLERVLWIVRNIT